MDAIAVHCIKWQTRFTKEKFIFEPTRALCVVGSMFVDSLKTLYLIGPDGLVNQGYANFIKI